MSIAKIVFICDKDKFSAKLQAFGNKWFGGSQDVDMPYHVAWLKDGRMFDMNWNFREIEANHYADRTCFYFNSPVDIPIEYLESMVGKRKYGIFDVALYFILTPLGINWMGTHCMEAINDDLWFNGYRTPWIPYGAPPTPTDGLVWAKVTLTE